MGDVFDRIVGRAVAPTRSAPTAAVTMRRTSGFAAPDRSAHEPEPGGSEAWSGASEPRTSQPLEPVAPANRPPSGGRRDEPEPGSAVPTGRPEDGAPASRTDDPQPEHGDPRSDPWPRTAALVDRHHPEVPVPGAAPAEAREVPLSPAPDRRPAAATARAELRARARPSPSGPAAHAPSTRTVPAEELLRGHLAPALGDRGALSARDDQRLTAVGLDPIEVPTGGDVHVHLGHVEVVQQAPARPAPDPPRPASGDAGSTDRVDHADYLARQQRRWS